MKLLTVGIATVGLVTAMMVASAQAQIAPSGMSPGTGSSMNIGKSVADANQRAENAKKDPQLRANDKAYDTVMKALPDKPYDPWRGVR